MTISGLQVFAPSTAMPGGPPGAQGQPGNFSLYKVNGQNGSGAYQLSLTDAGSLIAFSGTTGGVAISAPPMTANTGWWCVIRNDNIAGKITITPTVGTFIDGQPILTIDPGGFAAQIIFDGTNFKTTAPVDGGTF